MTDALIFSWSGSFREDYTDRHEEIAALIGFAHSSGMEVGLVAEESREQVESEVADLDLDFAVGAVQDIETVMAAFYKKYDAVFFVTDVRAELASVNRSGAYTIGYNSDRQTADKLGGIGPNYIVDSLDEVRQILLLEHMP